MTTVLHGDCRVVLRTLEPESIHCCVTSPPYWGLRAYGGESGMIGLEPTWDEHLTNLLESVRGGSARTAAGWHVLAELRRCLCFIWRAYETWRDFGYWIWQ